MMLGRLLIIVSIVASVSCARYKVIPKNSNGDPIVSDQFDPDSTTFPGGVPRFMTLLKLHNPALLSTAKRTSNGAYVIDPILKNDILAEQQALEAKLAQLSPDIRVLYRYRMVLNAIAIEAPQSLSKEISDLEDVLFIEADERFSLPKTVLAPDALLRASRGLADSNSMKIIGALKVHTSLQTKDPSGQLVPVRGKGVRVGIIDSGIDYTHALLGGPGDAAVFQSIDATKDSPLFPTTKVVGGRDFVGANFNTGSHIYSNKIPVPDNNPLDQSGHGSHVAGTVAGIGDGSVTYNGAAPDAELFALKVFGDKGGSTSDTSVIAALEYAADPNGDFDNSDRLHVVNLSLGGSYGKPHSLYNLAIANLTNGGTLAVVAAGNDGAINNIVGSPSTANEALSVAASVDDTEQNWQFPAIEFSTVSQPKLVAETVEGTTTKPIRIAGNVTGKLVYVGLANQDLSAEMVAAVQGNVALIDRGEVSFDEKITRVAGAIGVVMVNNSDEPPFRMGGEGKFDIPGVMISKALGDMIKADMASGIATIQFLSNEKIKKPELIDTIVGFSSQGPRTIDSYIKPEITAPGYNIISAAVGSGTKAARMSGTSMSSPHVAGLAALLVQYRPDLTPLEIKALLMNTSEIVDDKDGNVYPISRQGAGRANVYDAATSDVLVLDSSVSLGEVQLDSPLKTQKTVTIKNISNSTLQLGVIAKNHSHLSVQPSQSGVVLAPGESQSIAINMTVLPISETTSELDAFLEIYSEGVKAAGVPIMAVANHLTQISASQSLVPVTAGTLQFTFQNTGVNTGSALLFQLLGQDARKPIVNDSTLASSCDLQSVGYRLIERNGAHVLQFASKLYNPITDWTVCDVNVEFDINNDNISDREIIGSPIESFPGLSELETKGFRSTLFDSNTLTMIFNEYRKKIALQTADRPKLDYSPALLSHDPMVTYDHSTVSIVEVPVTSLGLSLPSALKVRVTVSYNDGNSIEGYDSLVTKDGEWNAISLNDKLVVPEDIPLAAGSTQIITVDNALNSGWISYFPRNQFTMDLLGTDNQSTVLTP